MQIAIASGKGGTGKTTISSNLANIISKSGKTVRYIDCDVEEPNGHLFLNPEIETKKSAGILVPTIDSEKCTGCGLCAKICQYKAIAVLGKKVLVFGEMCHGCGGCYEVCPVNAITEVKREIGVVEIGKSSKILFTHGKLNIGEAMSPPLIRDVKKELNTSEINIVDVPPGTSCPVITSISNSDYVVLVTEPTPFGLNDLGLAIDMVKELKLPFGIVVNRHESDNLSARVYCKDRKVPLIAEIPDDRRVAVAYSNGKMASNEIPEFDNHFKTLLKSIQKEMN